MYPYLNLFGRNIPSYGLCMAIGILLSCCICFIRGRRNRLDSNSMMIILACAIGFGLFGAKLLYLLVSCNTEEVFQRLLQGDISHIVGGGQVFYGGLIGGILGALVGARISGVRDELDLYCDAVVPAVPFGHAFGRIGCFLGGCCYGMPYTGVGAVACSRTGIIGTVFPVQLLEAALNMIVFIMLILPWKKWRKGFFSLFLYMVLYSTVRFTVEFFRGDEIRGMAQGLSTSQWISIGLFICGLILLIRNSKVGRRSVR